MQRIDEEKRKRITEIAGRLFTKRPFHEVRLEDVAAEAHIGKGTIYVYFKSKADLCRTLMQDELVGAIGEARKQIGGEGLSPLQKMDRLMRCLASFARKRGYLRSMEREVGLDEEELLSLREKRDELLAVIEGVLREGISQGEMDDPHPELTARYLLAILREIAFFPTPEVSDETFGTHILRILKQGVAPKEGPVA